MRKYHATTSAVLLLSILVLLCCCVGTADAFFGFGSKKANKDDLYGTLGVSRGATESEIKKAFRNIARTDHPDNKQTTEEKEAATIRMQDVLRAYTVLSDKDKRQEYDRYGSVAGEQPAGGGPPPGQGGRGHPGGGGGGYPPEFEEFMRRFGGRNPGSRGGPQRTPIDSAAPTITLGSFVEKVLAYRGRRLHVIHTYSEFSGYSRAFAGVWEQFLRTPLASSAAVSSWRLRTDFQPGVNEGYDAAEEGAAIARFLVAGDLTQRSMGAEDYISSPGIYAVVDGRAWELTGLTDHLSNPAQAGMLVQRIVEFVRGFYVDFTSDILLTNSRGVSTFLGGATPTTTSRTGDNIKPLPSHRVGRPVHIIMTPLKAGKGYSQGDSIDAMIGMAAGLDEPKVEVRFVSDVSALVDSLKDTCGLQIVDGTVDIIVVVDATLSIPSSPSTNGASIDSPSWCKIAQVSSSKVSRLPRRRLQLIRDMYITDASLIRAAYPNRVPIIRGPNDFLLKCVHGDNARDCIIWARRDCKKSGVLEFFDAPLWATNPDRFGDATLLGLCLDRQPRINAKVGTLLDELYSQMLTVRHRPSRDALLLFSQSRGEGTTYTMYLHEDLDRGGGLTDLERLLREFRTQDHVTKIKGAVTDILPMEYPLPALFLDEAASYRVEDLVSITHNSNPPIGAFPIAWWRMWVWKAHGAYTHIPFNSLIPIIVLYLIMSSCGGLCRRGGNRGNNNQAPRPAADAGGGARNTNTPFKDPVRTSISTFNIKEDLDNATGPPMLTLVVLHPLAGVSYQQASSEAFRDVTSSSALMSDARFRYREVSVEHNAAVHEALMARITTTQKGTPKTNYTAVAVWRKKRAAAVKPDSRTLEVWCSGVGDGEVRPEFELSGPAWSA